MKQFTKVKRLFNFSICDKKLNWSLSLKIHKLTHNGEFKPLDLDWSILRRFKSLRRRGFAKTGLREDAEVLRRSKKCISKKILDRKGVFSENTLK